MKPALGTATGTGSTHHLVMREGAEPGPGFTEEVRRAVAQRPDAALAFQVDWNSWNGSAVRLAALRGCAWAAALPQAQLPALAFALPARQASAFAEYAARHPAAGRPDAGTSAAGTSAAATSATGTSAAGTPVGSLVAAFARERGLDVLIRVHSAVEDRGRLRDEVSPLPTILPQLLLGRARIALWDAGAAVWRQASWTDHLVRIGRSWPGAAPAAVFVAITDRPSPPEREEVLPLAEVVGYGVAIGALLERAPCEHTARAVRGYLSTAVLGAIGPTAYRRWLDQWTDELTDVLWRAVGLGARLRSNHGVTRWRVEELRRLPEATAAWSAPPGPLEWTP
ncbi:hypothetical protein [Kitasatospora sp. GAS1066B]|uniref:hypothetical protein n=1 Tax=Kitasatospora sp. GAS1066B TaxID=3156271 RepID=UPI0035170005